MQKIQLIRFTQIFKILFLFCFITSLVIAQTDDQERKEGILYQNQSRATGYPISKLLKETNEYKLYGWYYSLSNDPRFYVKWCSDNYIALSLVFKGGENLTIDNDESYWRRFDNELLPVITSQCPVFYKIIIHNYIQGFQIDHYRKYVSEEVGPGRLSDGINIAVYSPKSAGKRKHQWFYGPPPERFDREPSNEPVNTSLTSVAKLKELWKTSIEAVKAEIAEEKRKAEAHLSQQRSNQRTQAAAVLKYYKKGASATFDFTGYSQKTALEKIYNGDFQTFTGKFKSESELTMRSYKDLWDSFMDRDIDRSLSNYFNNTGEMVNIVAMRNYLKVAFFAYHNTYAQLCRSDREMIWDPNIFTWVTKDGYGNIKGETEPISLPVRIPFEKAYNTILEKSIGKDGNKARLSTPEIFSSDFTNFLKSQGCGSASVRHFETNLYLANEWLWSVQELQKP